VNNKIPLERIKETIESVLNIFGTNVLVSLEVGQVFVKTNEATWIVYPDVHIMELLEGGVKVEIPGWSVVKIDYTQKQKRDNLGTWIIPKDVAWNVACDMITVSLR
jgi:hypothetical protein